MIVALLALLQVVSATPPAEDPVAPYVRSNANADATPFAGDAMWRAFGGAPGIGRIVDGLLARSQADRRITDIFRNQDMARLSRTLREQFCYILGGGCDYTGRAMRAAHKDLGIQQADMAALVENLQAAMQHEHVPFAAQNRFLSKLAPMHRDVVER